MRFDWDDAKAARNVVKHGIGFELAQSVWNDRYCKFTFDRVIDGEERWHATGAIGHVALLVVVHSYIEVDRLDWIRIISARPATIYERRRYERETA